MARSSFYQSQRKYVPRQAQPELPSRKLRRVLEAKTTARILEYLRSERFVDRSPVEVFYTLLDERVHLGSISTFYRLLRQHDEVRERRAQRRHPSYHAPELVATRPNQVWSWDITKVRGPRKGVYFHLYVIIDLFSRKVVGWMVADRESGDLAAQLISETCRRENIVEGQLTIHSDRGPSMQSMTVVQLHAYLGVTKSNSRPYVSNDNPFSESQFKTLKYHPGYPDRFACLQECLSYFRLFFGWYNHEHRHSGIEYLTPEVVHSGQAEEVLESRYQVLLTSYEQNPTRFSAGPPRRRRLPKAVYINPPSVDLMSK